MPNKETPNFSLLIGHSGSGKNETKDAMDKTAAEDSAVKSLMTGVIAKDMGQVKQALKDFIEACYPSVVGDEDDMPEPEAPPPDDSGSADMGPPDTGADSGADATGGM